MAPTATSHRREIELEDLCGLAAPEAIERLRGRELRPAIEPYEVDDPARHACVLEQHPPAGERVRHGQLVTLIVGQHTPPSAAAEVPLPAHDAPAVDREPELAQRATWTGQERSSAMPASAAGVEDESEPQAVLEEPEPELGVISAGWQPIPDDQAPLPPPAGRARGGGVASRRGRRRQRWVWVLAVVLVGLAGLSLVAGQRRAAGSHGVARAVSSLRSETSVTSSTTSPATSVTSATVPSAAARAAGPRPARRRRADHHHREQRGAVSALPVAAASASTPASAPVAPVAGAPESAPPAPALTTPRAAAAPAGSGVVVVPPSATGPLAGPYPNQ
ncbi:MAG: PASTA domain-containing protein [Solirubrobacteraceae bacterium]